MSLNACLRLPVHPASDTPNPVRVGADSMTHRFLRCTDRVVASCLMFPASPLRAPHHSWHLLKKFLCRARKREAVMLCVKACEAGLFRATCEAYLLPNCAVGESWPIITCNRIRHAQSLTELTILRDAESVSPIILAPDRLARDGCGHFTNVAAEEGRVGIIRHTIIIDHALDIS